MHALSDHIDDCHPERTLHRAQDLCNPVRKAKVSRWRHSIHILWMALREIFDERAYDRYLARTHAARGRESYRAFTTERIAMTALKPRCC